MSDVVMWLRRLCQSDPAVPGSTYIESIITNTALHNHKVDIDGNSGGG